MAGFNNSRSKLRSEVICRYYHKKGHLKEKRYELGFPMHFRMNRRRIVNANQVSSYSDVSRHKSCDKDGLSTRDMSKAESLSSSLNWSRNQVLQLLNLLHVLDNSCMTNPSFSATTISSSNL